MQKKAEKAAQGRFFWVENRNWVYFVTVTGLFIMPSVV